LKNEIKKVNLESIACCACIVSIHYDPGLVTIHLREYRLKLRHVLAAQSQFSCDAGTNSGEFQSKKFYAVVLHGAAEMDDGEKAELPGWWNRYA
jgi:hypothetical protein